MIETLTALLVGITGFYAFVTFKIFKANQGVLSEMQKQYEALNRPYISISPSMVADSSMFYLKIKNTGKTAAHNLKLTIDKDFFKSAEKNNPKRNLKKLSAFNAPIDSFVPGSEMLFSLATGPVIFGKDADEKVTPKNFSIFAEYEFGSRKIIEKTIIDLRPFLNSNRPNDAIVQKLKELIDVIKKMN